MKSILVNGMLAAGLVSIGSYGFAGEDEASKDIPNILVVKMVEEEPAKEPQDQGEQQDQGQQQDQEQGDDQDQGQQQDQEQGDDQDQGQQQDQDQGQGKLGKPEGQDQDPEQQQVQEVVIIPLTLDEIPYNEEGVLDAEALAEAADKLEGNAEVISVNLQSFTDEGVPQDVLDMYGSDTPETYNAEHGGKAPEQSKMNQGISWRVWSPWGSIGSRGFYGYGYRPYHYGYNSNYRGYHGRWNYYNHGRHYRYQPSWHNRYRGGYGYHYYYRR